MRRLTPIFLACHQFHENLAVAGSVISVDAVIGAVVVGADVVGAVVIGAVVVWVVVRVVSNAVSRSMADL